MCIIVLNKKNLIDKKTLQNCWDNNPDGAGLVFSNRGRIETFKELKNFELFFEYYKTIRSNHKKSVIALHFRIRTHGLKNENNIHPFFVNENLSFMHNGIIDINLQKKSEISDTAAFTEKILKLLPSNFLSNYAICELIKKYTSGSKLLFLDNKNKFTIFGEHSGIWTKGGNWFSNYSYLDFSPYSDFDYFGDETKNKPKSIYDCYDCLDCGAELQKTDEIHTGFCIGCFSQDCK